MNLWILGGLVSFVVFATAGSQILLKGGVSKITPSNILRIGIALALLGCVTVANVAILKFIEIKVLTAYISTTYIVTVIFARIFLQERIRPIQWTGSIFIVVGVFLFNR